MRNCKFNCVDKHTKAVHLKSCVAKITEGHLFTKLITVSTSSYAVSLKYDSRIVDISVVDSTLQVTASLALSTTKAKVLQHMVDTLLTPASISFKIKGIGLKIEDDPLGWKLSLGTHRKSRLWKSKESVTLDNESCKYKSLIIPEGVWITSNSLVTFAVNGYDKVAVGNFAHRVSLLRKPNNYKFFGIYYENKSYKLRPIVKRAKTS